MSGLKPGHNPYKEAPQNITNSASASRRTKDKVQYYPETMSKIQDVGENASHTDTPDPRESSKAVAALSESALAGLAHIPDLDCLQESKYILLKQEVSMIEKLCGGETNIRYQVIDESGRQLFQANNLPVCCAVYGIGKSRPYRAKVFDLNDQDVLQLSRPCTCLFFRMPYWPCCWPVLYVYSASDELIGSVVQKYKGIFRPRFSVKNTENQTIMRLEGSSMTTRCFGALELEFHVLTPQGRLKVGQISRINNNDPSIKIFQGDYANMKIEFPKNANVPTKALLIAAALLIDWLYYKPRRKYIEKKPGTK